MKSNKIALMASTVVQKEKIIKRLNIVKGWAYFETQPLYYYSSQGPRSIESMYEEYLGAVNMMRIIQKAQQDGCRAAIITCAGDPGIDVIRRSTNILVLGTGETAMSCTAMLGRDFSVITIEKSVIPSVFELAYKAGYLDCLASVRAIDIPVLSINENQDYVLKKTIDEGRKCIEKDGAKSLVLGCATLSFLGIEDKVSRVLGVPVINSSKATFKFAEALGHGGLTHSKKTYPNPKNGLINFGNNIFVEE